MGRTLPTAVQLLHLEGDEWKHFRRSLRKEDQDAFDALWRFARRHAASISMASRPVPFDGIVMAMLVGLAREVLELQRKSRGAPLEENDRGLDI
jgi:hypothetical protein